MVQAGRILVTVLILYWLALSGYFNKPALLVTGAISVVLVTVMTARMKILDAETVPYTHGRSPGYFVWLFREIIRANVAVVKAVLSPEMEISPTLLNVKTRHSTDLGKTVFANSITLTPGTVSVEIDADKILVHALLQDMADPAGFLEMSERSGRAVGDPMTGPGK